MKVPVFDLTAAIAEIESDLRRRWSALLDSKQFVGGAEVADFEAEFARFLGAFGAVGVGNGTDALILALRALGAGPGDEVLVPAFTFAATASTVAWVGARPVFVDVETETLNLDPELLEEARTDRTVGVVGVHLYGLPCAVERIAGWCRKRGLWLIEDAAQAHGARVGERPVGSFGDLATWSFYPSKNLGCFGDGGAITGHRAELVERARLLANHGAPRRYDHHEIGTNSRLDAFQAAVLACRLPLLEGKNERRRELAGRYRSALEEVAGIGLLEDRGSVFHQFAILVEGRDELQAHLAARGIGTAIHYPAALPDQPCFREEPAEGDGAFRVARRAARNALCLPMYPEMSDVDADFVVGAIRDFFAAST